MNEWIQVGGNIFIIIILISNKTIFSTKHVDTCWKHHLTTKMCNIYFYSIY